MPGTILLALNSGSSSLKFAVFEARNAAPDKDSTIAAASATRMDSDLHTLCSGDVDSIGSANATFSMRGAQGELLAQHAQPIADVRQTTRMVAERLHRLSLPVPNAIGHRIVHGGPEVREHTEITPAVLQQLHAAAIFAPLHIPAALSMIEETRKLFPGVPQFACLDTAFHRHLSEAAARFALPARFWRAGVRRYGFHGLSCESILHTLGADVPPRLVIAHLGSGASLTAVANGSSVDTTMGLTPTGGIVMGTRSGDLDPGVLLHLLRTSDTDAARLEKLLDKESGLLGVSGISADLRELHRASGNSDAQLAVEIFCRSAKKALGSLVAILGGLDLLVFTGGIGEHDAVVRAQICDGLECMGILLDSQANEGNLRAIASAASRARVYVIPTDENAQIARHTYRLLKSRGTALANASLKR